MSKFQKLYESILKENDEIKALLLQKRQIQDKIRNNPSNYPEESKIDQSKIKVIDKKINLAKEKDKIEDEVERIQDQSERLQKKKANDAKNKQQDGQGDL